MKPLRRHFYRKSDLKALAALIIFVVVASGLIWFVGGSPTNGTSLEDSTATEAPNDYTPQGRNAPPQYYDQGTPKAERFTFDPNTADSTQLLRLGLAPYMVRGIYKYRANGGVYRRPEDFARVPGLTQGQYRELKPYIRISADFLPASELPEARHNPYQRDTLLYPRKISEQERITLNTADTTQLKRIPGIGSHFARRIVAYGKRLGGYVSIDQLDEIEDFPTESKKYLVVSQPATTRLNVNKLSVGQLKRHPYMGFYRAKAIADYRRMHGPLQSLEEMKFSPDFTPEAIRRLEPYVEF